MNIKQRLLHLALPVTANALINVLTSIITMLMVAQLGHKELAAGALATSTYIAIMVFSSCTLYSVGILTSHLVGAEQQDKIRHIVHSGFAVGTMFGIPTAIALWYVSPLLSLFGQEAELVRLTVGYFQWSALGIVPLMWAINLQQVFNAIGEQRFVLYLSIARIPVSLVLAYGFIYGKLGMPALGLAGAAAGITLTLYLYIGILYLFVKFKPRFANYNFLPLGKPDWQIMKNILNIGVPIGLQFGGELFAITMVTYFMGWLGSQALAAQQIITQAASLVVMFSLGIAQAVSILVSEANGSGNVEDAKQITYVGMRYGLYCMMLVSIVYLFFPTAIIHLFIDESDPQNQIIVHIAKTLFLIAVFIQTTDMFRNILSGALRGFQDSTGPMKIGIICLWFVAVPASYIFAFPINWGPVGLRVGFLIGFVLCTVVLWRRFNKRLVLAAELSA